MSVVLSLLIFSTKPALAFECSQIFASQTPQQKTQFYISKDIITFKNLKNNFLQSLETHTQKAQTDRPLEVKWFHRQLKRDFNDINDQFKQAALKRLSKQHQRIHHYMIENRLTVEQSTALKKITKKIEAFRERVKHEPPIRELKRPNSILQVEEFYLIKVERLIIQYEFLTVYTHALMHQFFEITKLRASSPLETLPVTYNSTGYKHNDSLERMWELMNTHPRLNFEDLPIEQSSSDLYIQRSQEFIADMDVLFRRIEKAIDKFELSEHFSMRSFRRIFARYKSTVLQDQQRLEKQIITPEQFAKNIIDSGNGIAGLVRSHIAEIWVTSRLPLNGMSVQTNVTGRKLLRDQKQTDHPEGLLMKELDLLASIQLFGDKIYFAGEVKLFAEPLRRGNRSNMNTLLRQIKSTRKILQNLGKNYEIHIFLIRGVEMEAKNFLESRSNVTVHGPIYQ